MKNQLYKYEVIFNDIFIVDRFTERYNVFNTLKDAKNYACKNLIGVNEQEHLAYKQRIRSINKQELFDNLFEQLKEEK